MRRADLSKREFSAEEILAYLQRRAKLLGHTPTVHDLNMDREGPSKQQIEKVFETYANAIELAGLEPLPRPWSDYQPDELIDYIRKWRKENPGAQLSHGLFRENPNLPTIAILNKRFGGLRSYLEAAGIPYESTRKNPFRITQ